MKTALIFVLLLFVSAIAFGQKPTPTPAEQPFLMPVEDVFYITGRGVVVTGQIERGKVKTGDTLEIVGSKPAKAVTVIGVEAFRKQLTEAEAGANVGLLLRGVEKGEVDRGQVVAKPGSIKAFTKFKAVIDMLTAADGGRRTPAATGYRPMLQLRTAGVSGVVTLLRGRTDLLPGGKGVEVEIELVSPTALERGQAFDIREGGRTVGSGKVTALIETK